MADQNRIASVGVKLTIGFKAQVVGTQLRTALQGQRSGEVHGLRRSKHVWRVQKTDSNKKPGIAILQTKGRSRVGMRRL